MGLLDKCKNGAAEAAPFIIIDVPISRVLRAVHRSS